MENVSNKELELLVGTTRMDVFNAYCKYIESQYDMDKTMNNGGKKWDYEYKFRRGGKTLCGFYFKDDCLGLMIIFGKDERNKVELIRNDLSNKLLDIYDNAETFHDGKWVMFELNDLSLLDDIKKLLLIKRKPNKKEDGKINE